MIPKAENQHIEFKLEAVGANELAEEIVGFANAEGGEIWLGVDDNGKPAGLTRNYEPDVMNICRSGCVPPIYPRYETVETEGKKVARIIIPKGPDRPYYTSRNRYYVRVGTTKRIASREELLRLFQAAGFFHYDLVELEGASPAEIDPGAVSGYFERYEFSFRAESEEEKKRLMRASDVLGPAGHPTVGGLLIFGVAPERVLPQAGIQFAHFKGLEPDAELLDKQFIGGNLPRQVENAMAALRANLTRGSTIRGARRVESPHYPDKVFRELFVNAVVHRNYSIIGAQIRVLVFEDRCEFISPGKLPNTVSIEKLSVGTSFARNPLLARFMENLGYVDRLGRGLPMVVREAAKLGCAVGFEEAGEEFRVTLPLP
jgi:ATP-dependent DNA helicase RecG